VSVDQVSADVGAAITESPPWAATMCLSIRSVLTSAPKKNPVKKREHLVGVCRSGQC